MAAEPVVAQKEETGCDQTGGWFMQAKTRMENIHFSTPHVQNLFDDGTCRYYWVISSSRVVELTNGTDIHSWECCLWIWTIPGFHV